MDAMRWRDGRGPSLRLLLAFRQEQILACRDKWYRKENNNKKNTERRLDLPVSGKVGYVDLG